MLDTKSSLDERLVGRHEAISLLRSSAQDGLVDPEAVAFAIEALPPPDVPALSLLMTDRARAAEAQRDLLLVALTEIEIAARRCRGATPETYRNNIAAITRKVVAARSAIA